MTELHEHVRNERNRRGWSVRSAATAGGISNTTWGGFESTGRVTDAVRIGVAQAFDWPTTWPESPPALTPLVDGEPSNADLSAKLDALLQSNAALHELVRNMGAVVERLAGPAPSQRPPDDQPSRETPRSRT